MSVVFKFLSFIIFDLIFYQTIFSNGFNHYCSDLDAMCDPTFSQPCCDKNNTCKEASPEIFLCVDPNRLQLGDRCKNDEECEHILHAKCSAANICDCRANNVRVANTCLPVLNGFCWKNEKCAAMNAACIDNTCACKANYKEHYNGVCVPSVLGSKCENNTGCSSLKFAVCSEDQTCTCSANTIEFEGIRCLPILDGFCWQDSECTINNSICLINKCQCSAGFAPAESNFDCIPIYWGSKCETNKQCRLFLPHSYCCPLNKECLCEYGYFWTSKACSPALNTSCSSADICSPKNSACIDNVCQCKPKYRQQQYRCLPIELEEPCEYEDDCIEIKHSKCSIDDVCLCDNNYIKTNATTCEPLISGVCSTNDSCIVPFSLCIDNKCQCGLGTFAKSNNNQVCAVPLGDYCLKNEDCWPDHSECINRICQCNFLTIRTSYDQCATPLGYPCFIDENCFSLVNGRCSENGICECKKNYTEFNQTACTPLLEGFCLNDEECSIFNSYCLDYKCQCKLNFLPFSDNRCYPLYLDQPCNVNYDDCIKIPNAECSPEKKCVCQPSFKAFGLTKCLSPVGKFCNENEDCIFYNNVYCIENKCQCAQNLSFFPSQNQCVLVVLGISCEIDENCMSIKNAECSKDKICICKKNHFATSNFYCAPFLLEKCSTNDDCFVNGSTCVDQKCQCQPDLSPVSFKQCEPSKSLYSCEIDSDCGDPWHSKCSGDNKCRCNKNNEAIDKSTCLPTIGGYCWVDHQCQVENSSCIDFNCNCNEGFKAASNNLCVPPLNM